MTDINATSRLAIVGEVIAHGPIPGNVVEMRDHQDDLWALTERGHWHMNGAETDGCRGTGSREERVLMFVPLTVTKVRDPEPAASVSGLCESGDGGVTCIVDNTTHRLIYHSGQPVPAGEPQRRLRACVERWPEAETGAYDPRCCRFPKSCSATVYDKDAVAEERLEAAAEPQPFEDVSSDRQCPGEHTHGGHIWYGPDNSYWCGGHVGRAGVPQPEVDLLDLVQQYGGKREIRGHIAARGDEASKIVAEDDASRALLDRITAEVERLRDERDSVLNNARDLRRMLDAQRERADDAVDSIDRHREAWEAEVERLKAAAPEDGVLRLPEVPEGAVALTGETTGRRYELRDGWWTFDDGGTAYSANLTALLADEGSVRVEMAPPPKPRTLKDNVDELRNWLNLAAEQKHWEYDEAIYCLDRLEEALVREPEDGTS